MKIIGNPLAATSCVGNPFPKKKGSAVKRFRSQECWVKCIWESRIKPHDQWPRFLNVPDMSGVSSTIQCILDLVVHRAEHRLLTVCYSVLLLPIASLCGGSLRILATLEAKTAKISNFWTFCPVILLTLHVSKICTFYIYGQWGKHVCNRSLKESVLAE